MDEFADSVAEFHLERGKCFGLSSKDIHKELDHVDSVVRTVLSATYFILSVRNAKTIEIDK